MTNAPTVTIGAVKNVFVRVMQFENSGCEELSHGHQFDHATLVASGAVKVTANGKETIFKAPHLIWIKRRYTQIGSNRAKHCLRLYSRPA